MKASCQFVECDELVAISQMPVSIEQLFKEPREGFETNSSNYDPDQDLPGCLHLRLQRSRDFYLIQACAVQAF